MTIHEHLKSIGACNTAINWASTRKTGQQCWDETERIDWIFWWARQSKQIEQLAICSRLITEFVAYLKNSPVSNAAIYADAAVAAATDAAVAAATDAATDAAADAAIYADADAAAVAAAVAAAAVKAATDAATATATAIYAATAPADAVAASLAFDKQKALILKIAKETLVCPFPG